MKHPERSEDYLEHIQEMIDRANAYLKETGNAAALEADIKTQDAVVRCIMVVGEAARQLEERDPEFSKRHPHLPWKQMRGMRNRIVHDYTDINVKAVWDTVKIDFPELDKQVRSLLGELNPAPEKTADVRPSFQEFRDQAERDKGKDTSRDR